MHSVYCIYRLRHTSSRVLICITTLHISPCLDLLTLTAESEMTSRATHFVGTFYGRVSPEVTLLIALLLPAHQLCWWSRYCFQWRLSTCVCMSVCATKNKNYLLEIDVTMYEYVMVNPKSHYISVTFDLDLWPWELKLMAACRVYARVGYRFWRRQLLTVGIGCWRSL